MSNFYEQLCQSFIRPSRQTYNAVDLGQPISQNGKRYDFHIHNNRNLKIVGSYFSNNQNKASSCILYLHSLNGSRLQSLSFAEKVLNKGLNFCSFDFSGTGLSEGKYVSLGYHQKFDILAVIQYINQKFFINKYILWGRSMGAAAGIKFMSMIENKNKGIRNHLFQIQGLILDSPFCSLSQITVQIAKQKLNLPQLLIKAVLIMVESSIETKAGFKISEMQMLEDMKMVRCPALILTSKEDKLVNSSHSQKIYEAMTHKDRQIIFIKGQHNANRQNSVIESILNFACRSMNKKKIGKQMLARSTKVLHCKIRNNFIINQTLSSKSSHKLSFEDGSVTKFQTCDDDITSYRLDEEVENMNQNSKKMGQYKKSLHLYSPKINNANNSKKITYMNIKDIGSINKSNIINQTMEKNVKINLTQKKFNINENRIKDEQLSQFHSDKKIESAKKMNRSFIQINRTPIKQPPIFNLVNNISNQYPQTPQKMIGNSKVNKQLGLRYIHSEKRAMKLQKIQQNHNQIQNSRRNIQLNHFNVINEKLKKMKRKQQACCISPTFKKPQQLRAVSVSIEKRKSQIPFKKPPQFIKSKFTQQNYVRNKQG